MRFLLLVAAATTVAVAAVSAAAAPRTPAAPPAPVRELGPFGFGAEQYWLFRPRGRPRAVVVFLHGLSRASLAPKPYRPWLLHLARTGVAVVYPRYELKPGSHGALRNTVVAVRAALNQLQSPFVPMVAIGYSRGGRLAVEYAALAPGLGHGLKAVLSVFPSRLNRQAEEVVDLRSIDPATKIEILVGDRDTGVGESGARDLIERLRTARFTPSGLSLVLVRSRGGFVADHDSPLETSPGARRAFWARADRMIRAVS